MVFNEKTNYTVCNDATAQQISLSDGEGFTTPNNEFEFQSDGYLYDSNKKPIYKPEYGHLYQVTSSGAKPLFKKVIVDQAIYIKFVIIHIIIIIIKL